MVVETLNPSLVQDRVWTAGEILSGAPREILQSDCRYWHVARVRMACYVVLQQLLGYSTRQFAKLVSRDRSSLRNAQVLCAGPYKGYVIDVLDVLKVLNDKKANNQN